MGTQLTTLGNITTGLATYQKHFASLLPATIPTERFMRSIVVALEENPKLQQCEPNSIYHACKMAAQDGLVIDGREAALVPYGKKATYMPMVYGVVKRARNTGDIDTIHVNIVYENDNFFIDYAQRVPLTFKPVLKNPGDPIGAICIVWNKSGGMEFEWMAEEEIMVVKSCSKQPNALHWTTFWTEGWKKTVLRRLFKRLPMSSELDRVFGEIDSEYDFSDKPADDAAEPAKPQTTRAAAAVAEQMGDGTQDAEFEEVGSESGDMI